MEHEVSVVAEAIRGECGFGEGGGTEGFDGVCVELFVQISVVVLLDICFLPVLFLKFSGIQIGVAIGVMRSTHLAYLHC
jgi:hypothetical protein